MTEELRRPLKAFLCHASVDKAAVRDLYKRLIAEGVDAWLDQEKLMPGQDWQLEIPRAVREADVVVACLSNKSVTKEGYVQKEIKFALDSAKEKPEGTIFIIPVRLEDCAVPERLSRWQWVDLFEENGYLRLLRSLKLRAQKVGAVIEPPSYETDDKEIEKRLDKLYTDGLAAFYTEDWDRACRRFEAILHERPNHKNASEKLVQAERQRNLAKLYARATEAYESENWFAAIQVLEELVGKTGEYKDAVQLLKSARKQIQLQELYAEAKTLYAAEKWQAVVKVFEKIYAIEPEYPDKEGLLISAQKEAEELRRLDELDELYSHGVREMDAGNWYEARKLLEQVHKSQTGFQETERLLRKVEHEITNIEKLQQRNIQIQTLYEQAHGLIRSKNWRKALDKFEEIQTLDPQFEDKDGIAETARNALELEEQEIRKQDQLAATYAEAVRLLKDEKYQEALDKWQELEAIDSKYPDRQLVQQTSQKKLAMAAQSRQAKSSSANSLYVIIFVGILALVLIVFLSNQPPRQYVPSEPLACPETEIIEVPFANGDIPTQTQYSYSGEVTIRVSGIGQSSGTDYADAFYIFADARGNSLSDPILSDGFSLLIDEQLAKDVVSNVPAYRDDHVYILSISASGNPLSFAVSDVYTSDNTGRYKIELCIK